MQDGKGQSHREVILKLLSCEPVTLIKDGPRQAIVLLTAFERSIIFSSLES